MVALLGITYHPQAWRRAQLRVDVGQLRARKELQASPGRGGEAGRVRALPPGAPASDHNAASSPASVRADPVPTQECIVARCHGPRRPKRDAWFPLGRGPWNGSDASLHAAVAVRASLQALRGALRGSRRGRACGMWGSPASPATRRYASSRIKDLNKLGVFGAEIAVSLLFADIRGSTGIAERMSPPPSSAPTSTASTASPRERSSTTTGSSTSSLVTRPSASSSSGSDGPHHTAAAIRAARALLDAVGHADATTRGPIPVGAAVHTGDAFVGSTGAEGAVNDFTALGDVVNTTARLASEAAAGELLVSTRPADAVPQNSPQNFLRRRHP